jgi:putative transposase
MVKSINEKRKLIDRSHNQLSLCAQCVLLAISRSSLYYTPSTESEENLAIMTFLDKQYYETPFYGSRKLAVILCQAGYKVSRKRVSRLMKLINWQTFYRAPNTSLRNKEHKIYPYLLRNMNIETKNQVWSTDITYIAMPRGFMYLCAIIDVYTRYVVGWSISNTMTAEWCLDILKEAVNNYGLPQIVNTDQGSQFTSDVYTSYLNENKIKISMDGKGRALDNIWIERLWRSVKYEDIYLKCYTTVTELETGIDNYFKFYNLKRPHENLNYKTPNEMYNNKIELPIAA